MKFITNSVFIIILFTVVVIGVGAFLFPRGNFSSSSSSTIFAQNNLFDFGQVAMDKGHVKHNFSLDVNGQGPIEITKLYTSCMCTKARLIRTNSQTFGPFGMPGHGGSGAISAKLQAGENFQIEADFDPTAHGPQGKGPIERKIIIETNSLSTPRVELTIKADVI
ncbi:hypothetical protein A2Z23_00735 [Candidatus Curtissbacteria bacterium RBG_16_39_7]|uniref:DUF1573 domain-containing protein n=1 Tax=Candidatus Curtissbacteria bacterium RBG_16_39_7 TaxID=1797707 RepID=A0A1F5G1P4_9BACT|nr:MAG: hypothetical protein A2Z23_00735 [Candidatus Curtissbacteria bacterium RBG_16_39_7]